MIETDRVLRPLREAAPAIERLDTYESPAVLTEALRATWHAADRTLRMLLRSDASAPDSIRMTAMSPEQMTPESVMTELRRRDLVSLGLAGRVHELRHALERAHAGGVRASDADGAREVVRCIIEEVEGAARRATNAAGAGVGTADVSPERAPDHDAGMVVTRSGGIGWPPRPLLLAGVVAVLLGLAAAAVYLLHDESQMDRGIAAFRADRHEAAEQHFRAALEQDDGNATARLYLARIMRIDSRYEEAAEVLRTAAARAPNDPAVRRELGYLFLDLGRARSAVDQFRRAVEADPEDAVNWTGLVHSLRQSGDSAAAAEWLRRAPEEAREMMGKE